MPSSHDATGRAEEIFVFDSLGSTLPTSTRNLHIRRLVDVLKLSIHRSDWPRAKRAWSILARCKEFDWSGMWRTGLLLSGFPGGAVEIGGGGGDLQRLEYLRVMMLRFSGTRVYILREIILRLISANRHQEALDELELYLPSFPYQDSPVLHVYAGLLCLFLAQPSQDDPGADSFAEVKPGSRQSFEQGFIRECKSHFQRALDLDPDNIVATGFLTKLQGPSSEESEIENESE